MLHCNGDLFFFFFSVSVYSYSTSLFLSLFLSPSSISSALPHFPLHKYNKCYCIHFFWRFLTLGRHVYHFTGFFNFNVLSFSTSLHTHIVIFNNKEFPSRLMKPSFLLYIFLVPLIPYFYLYRVLVKKLEGKKVTWHN